MKLDEKIMRLIAIGASITANCQPCLQVNISKAFENGCNEQEITEAIEIGKMVSRGAISKMDKYIANLNIENSLTAKPLNKKCDGECS